MSFYDAIRVGASGAADYEIERSLRFDPNDTYMERTPSSAGNRKTFTISLWFKLGILQEYSGSDGRTIFGSGGGGAGSSATNISLLADAYGGPRLDFLSMLGAASGSNYIRLTTNAFIRDPSAWYHVVVKVDTPQGNSPNRAKMYINGDEVSDWYNYDQPDQNADTYMNVADKHGIGANRTWANQNTKYNYFGGYIAEFHFLDGTAYDASYFGETDSKTGQWIPKEYTGGNYGTNGFYLKFADNSGTTATTLGKDSSGNSNNYTPYGFSVAAGTGNDSLEDTPTNNFCTLNPLDKTNGASLREGALTLYTDSNDQAVTGTFAVNSGKWYWEVDMNTTEPEIGIAHHNMPLSGKSISTGTDGQIAFIVAGADGNSNFLRVDGNTQSGTGITAQSGPGTIGIALDADNKKIWFTNTSGSFFNSGNPATGANAAVDFSSTGPNYPTGFVTPFVSIYQGAGNTTSINFGQRAFSYTAPTGFKKLNSANLPDPTIVLPDKHFDLLLYTGTDSAASRTLTGLNFSPDWVWQKRRNGTNWNTLHDTVRGVGKTLYSNDTSVDTTNNQYGYISAFTSDGFTWSPGSTNNSDGNETNGTFVSWCWNAGGTDSATYTVKVVSDSGNKYRFNDFGTSAVTLDLAEGGTYTFDQSDSSMSSHPMQLSTTANGTHGGGSAYSTGVTYQLDGSTVTASAFISGFSSASSRKLIITVAASAPTLYYYCYYHSGMGGAVNTNSTLGSSNFDGTIQSTVKTNTTAGFSIVTYTGTGADGTVGHGLGVKPDFVVVKNRDSTEHWTAKHKNLSSGYNLKLNLSEAEGQATGSTNGVIGDLSSSSNFSLTRTGNTGNYDNVNINGDKHVAYCFTGVAGYSSFGKYTGNGTSSGISGPFVYTGFRPAWVLLKGGNFAGNWNLFDKKRPGFNVTNDRLFPNIPDAETDGSPTNNQIDILSNGFKLRGSNVDTNSNTSTFIYLAFAESPFKNSRAR
jgi:hypothetical protein